MEDDDEVLLEGVGYNSLFNTECSVYFDRNKIQIDEAERYLEQYINNLDKEMVDKILHLACEWKNEQVKDYPDVDYMEGLKQATRREIMKYIQLCSIHIYKNPYDSNDMLLGASVYCVPNWDEENHMEIIIKGKEVLEVREFLGYGEFAIWDKNEQNECKS